MASAPPFGGFSQQDTTPSSKVELSVSCKNLQDKDVMSKSDPLCVMYIQDFGASGYREYGRTEMVKNCLNPDFVKKFIVTYYFEEVQKLKFEIYDVDSASAKLDHHDFLGRMECTLGEIVGYPGSKISKKLQTSHGHHSSVITVSAEEVSSCKDLATLQFRAEGLDKKDFFGKSDPFLVFYRANEDNTWTLCHKSEYIKNTLKPVWKPFSLPVTTLCNGDYDRAVRVECYDYDNDGSSHDLIGIFQTTLRELTGGPGDGTVYDCVNPKKKSKRGYKNSGKVYLLQCQIEQQHSFLDFVRGGTQLHFTVAIDFTASNGNPTSATSLHYMSHNLHQPNQYSQAIQAVGNIIQDYDSDKLFPVLGFGAKVPPTFSVSHEFFVNLHPDNPYCQGVGGILQAYQQCLQSVQLYGPTNFSPIINHVARFAHAAQDGSQYFVLLIITDGVITDMPQTKQAIIHASQLPLSIIIVGVGGADFTAMEELDSDREPLSWGGQSAARDIVQFVPFREYQSVSVGPGMIQARLAKDVLAEVPTQLVSYMRARNIRPRGGPPGQHTPAAPQTMDIPT